ncbi:hypothetical protein ACOMHN_047852 [Nucella lapillus]
MKVGLAAVLWIALMAGFLVQGKRHKHRNRRRFRLKDGGEKSRCKYFCEAEVLSCDPLTQTQTVSFPLKKGVNCPPHRNFTKPCGSNDQLPAHSSVKGCKYDRRGAQWSACGPGVLTRTKVMRLKEGQSPSCPPVKTKTVPCKKKRDKGGKGKKKGKGKACKYQKGAWSACDPASNERIRELTLRKGDESVCLPKKVITKKCKKACKYTKGPWTPCSEDSKEKTRQLTLKKGDPHVCNASMVVVKSCRRRDAFTATKTSQCKYKPLAWSECDVRTNTMLRTLTLKSGDPALCTPTKELTRKCRKPCKFSKGEWSECEEGSGLRTRTDHLVKGAPADCEPTRVISRKCGMEGGCKYEVGPWGECDDSSKERTRIKTLISGDPEICRPQIQVTRPCFKANGEENCFLGTWGDYGPCQNGVMMKHRPVIAGGVQCERKAVKTKPCSS